RNGRDPATMTWSAALVVCCGEDEEAVRRRAANIGREPDELRANGAAGTVSEVVDRLGAFVEAGAERIYLQVLDMGDLDHLRLVAAEVAPAPPCAAGRAGAAGPPPPLRRWRGRPARSGAWGGRRWSSVASVRRRGRSPRSGRSSPAVAARRAAPGPRPPRPGRCRPRAGTGRSGPPAPTGRRPDGPSPGRGCLPARRCGAGAAPRRSA